MKIRSKEKRLCGGKLILTNFKRLNPQMFKPLYDGTRKQLRGELSICAPNGDIYINATAEGHELVAGVFENIMPESKDTLEGYIKEMKSRFPEINKIKNIDDWASWAATEPDKEKMTHALAVLMVPLELQRRNIERGYYGKIRVFPS